MTRSLPTLLILLLALVAAAPAALAQTPLPGGFQIHLLPGYAYEPLQGIDSIVGRIVKKEGLTIQFEMGRIPQGGFRLGGDYSDYTQSVPEQNRQWYKEQTIGGRKVHVVLSKDHRLTISTASKTEGINFTTTAKTADEVADVLLMVLSLTKPAP